MARLLPSILRAMICFFALALAARSTLATCTTADWRHELGLPEHGAIYSGVIGGHHVRMMLHLDAATGRLNGFYGYDDQPGTLLLSGTMLPDGSGAGLAERDSQGQVTGHLSLSFAEHSELWQNPVSLKKYPERCDAPTGTWRSLSANSVLRIDLHRNGEWIPGSESEENLDDVAAFKLKKAILEKNKAAFASLLNYPFYTLRFRSGTRAWNHPEEVIMHFDEIMLIPIKEVRNSVPHVLAANPTGAQYMSGSVYLAHGRVTMICEGSCPVVASFGHPQF